MDAFDQTTRFIYNLSTNANRDSEFSGILDIYIHRARNIHNICIYDNQDVYAMFSLTYNPDETPTTRIINGGGKNPEFNENLVMKVTQFDALLKCEMWMLSRAKNYMEDQLLGFALVPLALVVGKGKVTQEFSLSSTDLFHSPAGTVKLSLSWTTNVSAVCGTVSPNKSITSEASLLARNVSEVVLDQIEYSRIEFPDINVVRENQKMVTEYFNQGGHGSVSTSGILVGSGSFLRLGSSEHPADDFEMVGNSSEENRGGSVSPNSGFFSSTMTSLSDDQNFGDSMEKKSHSVNASSPSLSVGAGTGPGPCPYTPTWRKESEVQNDKNDPSFSLNDEENKEKNTVGSMEFGQSFSAPLGNVNLETEQSVMQQKIVDMYMRSMQQFSESLAKMKLLMDFDSKPKADEDHGEVTPPNRNNNQAELEKKKDASRVFYGSSAFF